MLWQAVALLMAAVPLGTRAATAVRAEIVGQVDSPATSPIPAAVLATVSMAACFAGGATIGSMYVVLQRQAAIKSAAVSLTTTAEVPMPARAPNRPIQ